MAQMMSRTRTFLDPAILTGNGGPLLGGAAGEPMAIVLTADGAGLRAGGRGADAGRAVGAGAARGAALDRHPALGAGAVAVTPLWQRYFLDLFLLVPPLYGWYHCRSRARSRSARGQRSLFQPAALLVPVLFCFSLGLLFLRFFPLLMKLLAGLAAWLPGTTLLLTLRQLARSTAQYAGPLLAAHPDGQPATFTASMAVTLDSHLWDQVYYQVGADLNLPSWAKAPTRRRRSRCRPGDDGSDDDRGAAVALSARRRPPGCGRRPGRGARGRLQRHSQHRRPPTGGADPGHRPGGPARGGLFPARFRYNESLGELMNRLAVAATASWSAAAF